MNSIFLLATGKQCLPLLTSDGQLQDWFAPVALILFVLGVVAVRRLANKAQSHAQLSGGAVLGIFIFCIVLVGGGWLMSQFFDPTC